MHARVRRHHDRGIEFFDDQRARSRLAIDGRTIDDIDVARRFATRKGYLPRPRAGCAGPRRNFHGAKVEPALAQTPAGDPNLHQLDRRMVTITIGLEVFRDEALAYLNKILAFEGNGEFGRLTFVAQSASHRNAVRSAR